MNAQHCNARCSFGEESSARKEHVWRGTCDTKVGKTFTLRNEIVYLRLASLGNLQRASRNRLANERRSELALLLQEIRSFVELPRPLSLPVGESTRFTDASSAGLKAILSRILKARSHSRFTKVAR